MSEEKVCPLMSKLMSGDKDYFQYCLKEKCALWEKIESVEHDYSGVDFDRLNPGTIIPLKKIEVYRCGLIRG